MKNYLKTFVPMILAIVLGSLTFVFAQTKDAGGDIRPPRGERGAHPPMGGIPPFVLEKLNLTDEQKTQIKTIEDATRAAARDNFDKMRAYDEQMRTLVDSGNFDEAQARQILNGKAQIQTELELARIKTDMAIKNVLTAEQKTQFEQLKQQRPPMPPDGFRPGMPPPPMIN